MMRLTSFGTTPTTDTECTGYVRYETERGERAYERTFRGAHALECAATWAKGMAERLTAAK